MELLYRITAGFTFLACSWGLYSNPRGGTTHTTINDPLVLNDYHAILLPKAVKYSAGIWILPVVSSKCLSPPTHPIITFTL